MIRYNTVCLHLLNKCVFIYIIHCFNITVSYNSGYKNRWVMFYYLYFTQFLYHNFIKYRCNIHWYWILSSLFLHTKTDKLSTKLVRKHLNQNLHLFMSVNIVEWKCWWQFSVIDFIKTVLQFNTNTSCISLYFWRKYKAYMFENEKKIISTNKNSSFYKFSN